jgi:hypothetical protein
MTATGREPKLTEAERFLLEWLGKEDSSAYGECHGTDLDELFRRGLAIVSPQMVGRDPHYRRVSLTEAGRAAISRTERQKP